MKKAVQLADETVQAPVVDDSYLERASADPVRIEQEFRLWKKDPEGYIQRRYAELRDYDFPVFAAINVRIQTKDAGLRPFKFNRIQRTLWRWLLEDFKARRPVRWFIVKSRQMGVSTFILVFFHWLVSMRANRNALIVAQDEAATSNFNSRVRSIHTSSHPLLKSPTLKDRRDELHFGNPTAERKKGAGPGLDSRIIFASAKHDELGRSYNFHAVHLSEFALWPGLGIDIKDQLVSLNQTIAKLPGTMVILESTAKGHNEATDLWRDPDNGYRKIFIPWVAHDEYRSTLKPGEEIENLCITEEIGGRQTRYGNEAEEMRLIEAALRVWYPDEIATGGEAWIQEEIKARLKWRRETIDVECLGSVTAFRFEYPTIEMHAFSSGGTNVFDGNSLELMRQHVKREGLPASCYSYIHDPEVTDANQKFEANPHGPLQIYEHPEAGRQYVLAADPGMGIPKTGDPSALVVLAVPELEEVACYNAIIEPDKFAELVHYLGVIYNGALVAVENNERGGFAANLILSRTLHYPRLYYRFDAFDKQAAGKPGFATTGTNKSVLVSAVQQAIRDHEILVRTPELITQLLHYTMKPNGEMGAPPGENDDLVSALLIAVHLSTKIHMYAPAKFEPPRGSFAWHVRQHEERRRPGVMGYNRRR